MAYNKDMLGLPPIMLDIVTLLVVYGVYRVVYTRRLLKNSAKLVEESKPFERVVPDASEVILVLGDSTAVGVGAMPADSTAGRLGAMYTNASVYNYAISGLKLAGLIEQMDKLPVREFVNKKADLSLIQIGANDLVQFTPLPQIERELVVILQKASAMSKKIIILHSGLAGTAPIFPFWIEWLWNNRARAVRKIYMRVAPKFGASYIDLITSSADTNFQKHPHTYYASDMFHPNGNGYELWFKEIKKAL